MECNVCNPNFANTYYVLGFRHQTDRVIAVSASGPSRHVDGIHTNRARRGIQDEYWAEEAKKKQRGVVPLPMLRTV